jgi:hypothetical protein
LAATAHASEVVAADDFQPAILVPGHSDRAEPTRNLRPCRPASAWCVLPMLEDTPEPVNAQQGHAAFAVLCRADMRRVRPRLPLRRCGSPGGVCLFRSRTLRAFRADTLMWVCPRQNPLPPLCPDARFPPACAAHMLMNYPGSVAPRSSLLPLFLPQKALFGRSRPAVMAPPSRRPHGLPAARD